jgi:DNA-binding NtrC family response regulator
MGSNLLLIADCNAVRRESIHNLLAPLCDVHVCSNTETLVRTISSHIPSAILIGSMPGGIRESIEAAHLVKRHQIRSRVIFLADESSETIAVDALRAGVAEYLRTPATIKEIFDAVRQFLSRPTDADECAELVGDSESMRQLKDLIRRVAPTNSTILIRGETGTGKEVVARLVHRLSRRAGASLVCVNCAAIPETLLESDLFGHEPGAFTGTRGRQPGQIKLADHGTLFLDEIGDMSLMAQAKLLRVIEEREVRPLGGQKATAVDVRLVTATHQHLESLTSDGRFRSDLYYRINVILLQIPPLRERMDDIPVLAHSLLNQIKHSEPHRSHRIFRWSFGAAQSPRLAGQCARVAKRN